MNTSSHTRLAVLGTIADMHRQPLAYNLTCLRQLVAEISPDLLCAEVTPETWESGNLASTEIEIREALAPIVAATDIVLIPVTPTPRKYTDFGERTGWKHDMVQSFEGVLRWGQRQANSPEMVNGWMFHGFCHTVCWVMETLWSAEDRAAWEAQTEIMANNILQAVRRDPGLRVLVAVQCQRIHRLVPLLHSYSEEIQIVHYQDL